MEKRKKIAWLTPDYFWESDFPIVHELAKYYDVKWYLFWNVRSKRPFPVDPLISDVFYLNTRARNPKCIKVYWDIIQRIRKDDVDILNTGMEGEPYFFPMLLLFYDKNKIVYSGHEVKPISAWAKYRKYWIKMILNNVGLVHVFSKHVEAYIKIAYPNVKTFYAPLLPEGYGEPTGKKYVDEKKKTFLFFGSIRPNKRLDLLLEAFCSMNDEYQKKSELLVYGGFSHGDTAEKYETLAEGYNNVHFNFGFVPNGIIADLYNSARYVVLPYADISQSGPHAIAFYYNTPCITSDADGFTERVIDKENGFTFKQGNADSLRKTLEFCIDQSDDEYRIIKENMADFVDKGYSPHAVKDMYINAFDSWINHLHTKEPYIEPNN